MKKMRAILAALLCLSMLMPVCGLASEGDAILARRDYETGDGFQDYIQYTLVRGDELVLIGGNAVYTWQVGQSDLTAYEWAEPEWMYSSEEGEEDPETGEMISYSKNTLAAYSDGEGIFLVIGETAWSGVSEFEGAYLYEVTLEDGKAGVVEIEDSEVDWEELTEYYEEDCYPKNIESTVWLDGVLYGVTYGDSDMIACAVPLDGGYSEVLEDVPAPRTVSAYKDGKLLFMTYEYSEETVIRFVAWDPAEEELEEICTLETEMYVYPDGVVYHEQTDRVYYVSGGSVVALDLATGAQEEVNDVPNSGGSNGAVMLPGGYYVLNSYDAIIVRNVDPTKRAQQRLTVNNANYAEPINSAYYDFANANGDVSVAISTEYMQSSALIEAMMNQSADYDIFVITPQEEAFDAVYNRGYMAELTGSEAIDQFFADMYPSLAEHFCRNGVPVALPLGAYGSTFGVSTEAMEKAGLTVEDIPDNWLELLDQFDEINAKLEGTGVTLFYPFYTQEDIRSMLFSMIFQEYVAYMDYTDPTMGFNTEVLRSVLDMLDAVDFEALGFEPRQDDGPDSFAYEDGQALFETYVSCTIGEYNSGYYPLLLSLTPDTEPLLSLNVTVAFVNPYSQNKELAIEYLEYALARLPAGQRASMCMTEIEPVRSSYYEEAVQSNAEEHEMLEKALAEANEEDKQMLEEAIAENERWAEDIDKYYWDISPQAIEWYRAHDDNLNVMGFNVLYSGESYSELYTYINQYNEGEISAQEMLVQMDKKLQMMILEGN